MKAKRNQKIEWSPEFAYAIGLLATDGNLSRDGRHINITSKDIQLLETFKKCLSLKNKIGVKSSGFSDKKYPVVQFGDIILYRWLLKIGLTPNKTKTIGIIKVPNKYFFDFLRGHFDGDGSCYSYWDNRWDSSFMFYLKFYTASKKHILWLRDKIKKLAKIKGDLSRNGKTPIYQLKYAKRESRILISKMYYKKDLPCLERKRKKMKIILNTDDNEIKRESMGE
jgi:hypothetical protein